MGGKRQCGPAVSGEFLEQPNGGGVDYNAALDVGPPNLVVPQLAEMDVLAGDAAEILPHAPQGLLDPCAVPVRERRPQIGPAQAMHGKEWSAPARDRAA